MRSLLPRAIAPRSPSANRGHARPHRGQSHSRAPVNAGPVNTCDRASHARQAATCPVGDAPPPSTSLLTMSSLVMVSTGRHENDACAIILRTIKRCQI